MIIGSYALYRKLKKQQAAKKQQKLRDAESRSVPQVVDPSFELFDHQQHIHDEYHKDHPSPDCTFCYKSNFAPEDCFIDRSPSSTSSHYSWGNPTYEQPHSPSEYSQCSTWRSGMSTCSTQATCSADPLRPAPLNVHANENAQSTGIAELEAPPSYAYAVATSPSSSIPRHGLPDTRPRLEPRLESPFSDHDPLESLPELPGEIPDRPRSIPSTSATENQNQDDGIGHRDDLVKRGLTI